MRNIPLALPRLFAIFGLPVTLVALWWALSTGSTSFYWPPLSSIIGTVEQTWLQGRLIGDVLPSVLRLMIGYLLALTMGVGMGVAVGSFPMLRALVEPVLEFFRAIPPPVLIPIIMLFAGIGDGMKIVVIVIGCTWPVLLNTVEGVRGIDEVLRDTARCYRLSRRSRIMHLTLRGASPQIAVGARQALSIGIILMVISEMFAASNGLGFTIIHFQRSFAIPQMWSGIILLGLLGLTLSIVLRIIETRALTWYVGLRRCERGEK